jgi:DNA polymerase-3 subunit epsilon
MIHKILQLTRPLIIPDTETTGLNPQEARIVEIGFEIWDATGLTKSWRTLVNPEMDIPKDATDTHHITDERVRSCRSCDRSYTEHSQPPVGTIGDPTRSCEGFKPWPTFKQLAPNLAKGFSNVDFAGKNIRYDLRVFAAEFDRAGVKWSYADAYIIDADRLEHLGEPRSLSHLYEKHIGKKLEGAHGALADVAASREVIEVQLQKYKDVLPHDLTALHDLQWPGYIDVDGKFKMINGVPTVAFGKWANKPMRNVEPSYWNWIIGADFSEDVKNIAREAKAGRFPMPPEQEHTL